MDLRDKTLFITGASRGIGLAIAKRAARDGANIAVAAKTDKPHPKLEGTIHTAAAELEEAGGRALPLVCDIRSEEAVSAAIEQTVNTFGGIDICINNASAISLTGTAETKMRRYDLMHEVNARGTFMVSKYCLPHLLQAAERQREPHILNISPPLNMEEHWFAPHVAYTMAKYGMSLCVLGMAGEFREQGLAINALWPRTTIATAAISNVVGGSEMMAKSRRPEIMADAAHWILTRHSRSCTGQFFVDDEVLREAGVTDFDQYAVDPSQDLMPDFFL